MAAIIVCVIILMILILIAVKMGLSKEDSVEDPRQKRMIHVSGIYSILRESPRKALAALRPNEEQIMQYLGTIHSDVGGAQIGTAERADMLDHWKRQTEANLQSIENGDKNGATYYYYDTCECPVCRRYITKGNFVTREEIYNHPQVIPPFHIGCTCALSVSGGAEGLRTTIVSGMRPFFEDDAPPPLPEWTEVVLMSYKQ